MNERPFRLGAMGVMDRFEAGRFGEKEAIKKNKKPLRRQKRVLEKRSVKKEVGQLFDRGHFGWYRNE